MNTIVGTENKGYLLKWRLNPFEGLYRVWPTMVKLHGAGKVHLTGTLRTSLGEIVDFELVPVSFEAERKLLLHDGDDVLFIVPVDINEGVEGAYLRILNVLRGL